MLVWAGEYCEGEKLKFSKICMKTGKHSQTKLALRISVVNSRFEKIVVCSHSATLQSYRPTIATAKQ